MLLLTLGSVYVATLYPFVGITGDSAKFQFVGRVLGTCHPSGYPTYLFINHLFTAFFPLGNLAWKANLLSAVFSMAMSLILFETFRLLEVDDVIAFAMTLTFGFTKTLWSQSIVAEVYSLNALYVCAVIYFFLCWDKKGTQASLLWGCAVYALSFGNHLTMITLLPAIVTLVLLKDPKRFLDPGTVVPVAGFILAGAIQYTYIFFRTADPRVPYLEMRADSFAGFASAVTGGEFRPRMFTFSLQQLIANRIPMFFSLLIRECSILLPASLLGVWQLRGKATDAFLLLVFLGVVAFSLNYDIPDISVYFIPAYLVVALFAAVGLQHIYGRFPQGKRPFLAGVLLLVVFFFFWGYPQKNAPMEKSAREIKANLTLIGKDALVIPSSYREAQYIWYYRLGEGYSSRNIFVTTHNIYPRLVKEYLLGRTSYYSRREQKAVPYGLSVYGMGEKARRSLHDSGFDLSKVGPDLYRVRLSR
jgi:hypothetical protein